ncbi:MAG: thermonuclease family protein [Alphaproteobacteria bacterium]|nr:thermonuclease family protein [Alphaproteobacteria bacterium]
MLFLKRVILGALALGFIFFGGTGTQSNGAFSQGVGFVGLVIGIIILYIFLKMTWRAMGCLPSFAIFAVIILFILFAIGAFSNGIENLGSNLKSFLGSGPTVKKTSQQADAAYYEEDLIFEDEELEPAIDENFSQGASENMSEPTKTPKNNAKVTEKGALDKIINVFSGEEEVEETPAFDPANLPVVYGFPKVINGDTIALNGRYFKLFGVDAPESNQTCADKQGRSYHCGKQAAAWLSSWITNNEIECRVMKKDARGNMVGICSLGQYDIGAALVNAGWAVADVSATDIYYSYEQQAQMNKTGLWQGRFYKPADWRKLQSKKPKIKVIKPKSTKKGIFDI